MLGAIFKRKTDEERLVSRIKDGDRRAMEQLYNDHARYLSAICSRYLTSNDDVRDVLQESFLRIFTRIDAFEWRGEGSLRGWLARFVVNETLKYIRSNSRIQFAEIRDECLNISDEEPTVEQVPAETLHRLIRELPDGYRTVFNLYVIEERSHKEIAALLGIKPDTSASQLHKAKAILARKINELKRNTPNP